MYLYLSFYEKCPSLRLILSSLLIFIGIIYTICIVDPILFWIPVPVSFLLLITAAYVYYQNYVEICFWCKDICTTLKMLSQMPDEEKMDNPDQ